MRKALLIAAASILIPFSGAQASVSSDVSDGLSVEQIIANAQLENLSIEQILQQIAAVSPSLVPQAVAFAVQNNPAQTDAILLAAFTAAPEQAAAISDAAQKAGVPFTTVVAQGVIAQVDPTAIQPASAAGGPNPNANANAQNNANPNAGNGPATAIAAAPITPPAFSNGGGGGGGGSASPDA
ncbi:MAG: hypothetical protein HRU06_22150 [Oceanospirillaceae bacterium]|nr:hypothetical protein [Colwellia sp.]NQZ33977.1 hypothetical protein [Oceanospirillaceae bacterium]